MGGGPAWREARPTSRGGGPAWREARQASRARQEERGKWVATLINRLIEYVEYLHEGCRCS